MLSHCPSIFLFCSKKHQKHKSHILVMAMFFGWVLLQRYEVKMDKEAQCRTVITCDKLYAHFVQSCLAENVIVSTNFQYFLNFLLRTKCCQFHKRPHTFSALNYFETQELRQRIQYFTFPKC